MVAAARLLDMNSPEPLSAVFAQQAVESLRDPVIVVDSEHRVRQANGAARRLARNGDADRCHSLLRRLSRPCSEEGVHCPLGGSVDEPAGKSEPDDRELRCLLLSPPSGPSGEAIVLCRTGADAPDLALRLADLALGVSPHLGADFFRELVLHLARALSADLALVGEMVPGRSAVRTLAVAAGGAVVPNIEYDLAGTPCYDATTSRRPCSVPSGVATRFPEDYFLAEGGFEGYVGTPLLDAHGAPLGIAAVLFRTPIARPSEVVATLEIFATRAAAELERLQGERREAALRERLGEAQRLELMGRLAGGVAHDFNNILTPILAYGEMLAMEHGPDDPHREDLDEIIQSAQRGRRLTQQLLALGRKQVLEMRRLDLAEVVAGFAKTIRRLLREEIALECLGESTRKFRADPAQVERILLNLVLNAQDALATGGRILVATRDADADGAAATPDEATHVCLEVTDDGPGVPREIRHRVFEPFFTTKAPGHGSGLGLATAQGIAEQHGGSLVLVERSGPGATFRALFPVAGDEEVAPEPPARSLEPARPGSETILLVEDEPPIRSLLSGLLRRQGYRVVEFAEPEACLDWARRNRDDVGLLLSDVGLPGMNGRRLHDELRRTRPSLPVLFVSGHADDVVFRTGALDPSADYLPKPMLPSELVRRVREILDRPARPGA